jgi:predicted unusual protein kinase regulating ubiquinone biosynthesis (AarF/ABC1/UbiB family)
MTTSNVVTMEYVPGIKINDISKIEEAGIDRHDLYVYICIYIVIYMYIFTYIYTLYIRIYI